VGCSQRYWRILIGPWLSRYLHAAYDRYVHLREAMDQHPGLQTLVMDPQFFRTPADLAEAAELISDDAYNLQMFSQQLRSLGYEFPERRLVERPAKAVGQKVDRLRSTARHLAHRGFRLAGEMLASRRPQRWVALCDLGSGPADAWRLAWRTKLSAVPIQPSRLPQRLPIFDERRSGLAALTAADEFERILVCSLATNFPVLYLEGFEQAREKAWRIARKRPAAIISAIWALEEPLKFLAAESSEQGARLCAVQHGGGYGVFRFAPTERHESRIANSYLVWGWGQDSAGHRNLPYPRLSSLLSLRRRKSSRKPADLLYIATAHPRYLWRFESTPAGSQWEQYFKWQIRFLSAASPGVRASLVFRPYREEYGQAVRKRIADRFPQVRWDQGLPVLKRLRTVGVAVIDHSATSFLETLVANVPTVLFWDPELWEVRAEAEPYFDSLREAGILWNTPEGACEKLEDIYEAPERWWGQTKVQEIRERFIRRYALASPDWGREWAQFIEECVTLRQAETISA
jgi:putative transferase (TIGR04331 family)